MGFQKKRGWGGLVKLGPSSFFIMIRRCDIGVVLHLLRQFVKNGDRCIFIDGSITPCLLAWDSHKPSSVATSYFFLVSSFQTMQKWNSFPSNIIVEIYTWSSLREQPFNYSLELLYEKITKWWRWLCSVAGRVLRYVIDKLGSKKFFLLNSFCIIR